MNFSSLRYALQGLSAYRGLLDEPVFDQATTLIYTLSVGQAEQQDDRDHVWGEEALSAYAKLFQALCDGGFDGIGDWLWDKLRYTETPFALSAQSDSASPALEQAARRDVDALLALAELDSHPDHFRFLSSRLSAAISSLNASAAVSTAAPVPSARGLSSPAASRSWFQRTCSTQPARISLAAARMNSAADSISDARQPPRFQASHCSSSREACGELSGLCCP